MLFLEILLSIHGLLWVSSWFIGTRWLMNHPSFKLKLARFLLVSCVVSPFIVESIAPSSQPARFNFVSFQNVQEYVQQPILKPELQPLTQEPVAKFSIFALSYLHFFAIIFGLLILFRGYHFWLSLRSLRSLLADAFSYRSSGKLIIKISSRCHIPFSVFLLNKAYVVLPVSLFSSSKNVKIAIAHEGQHHRNGDCLWAYFIEILRIIFFGNRGVTRWGSVLSELQEFSCDEVLVGHPKISAHDYGHCLFNVVQTVSQCSLPANRKLACTVGMASYKQNEDSTFIIRRISMLSSYSKNASKSLLLGVACAGFSIFAPICIAYSAAGTLTSTKTKAINTFNLDPTMQNIAAQEINTAVKHYQAKSGVIAIADPSTGTIIAFAESGNGENNSWKSRVFSPGSTIKPFIAAAAIDAGTSFETKNYDCHSPYILEDQKFTNYDSNLNSATLSEAIAKSINVCLIKVAQDTGVPVIRQKLTQFGFDTTSWWQTNKNNKLQLAKASLGENIPVTIESLTKSYSILAHKGRLFNEGNTPLISAATTKSINHMLENAVIHGTGKQAALPGIAVAGKTGTVIENNDKHLALFAGYVPANSPRYVMVVVIEEGHLSAKGETLTSGGALAAPVFHNVARRSLNN